MPKREHEVAKLARLVKTEIDADVEELHTSLVSELFEDAGKDDVGEQRYLQEVGERLAADPAYAQQFFVQVGPREFNRVFEKLAGLRYEDSRALRKQTETALLATGEIE